MEAARKETIRGAFERAKRPLGTNGERGNGRADTVAVEQFYAFLPQRQYIYVPTGELWLASSVDSAIGSFTDVDGTIVAKASTWLDRKRAVEQMTWAPGLPQIITDLYITQGGWRAHPGGQVFNLYLPPVIARGDALKATEWIGLVRRIYPDAAEHIFDWFAHRVQRPYEKLNHALVLGGAQGIGKDTILEPLKHAVGPWNFIEVSPIQLLGRFNGFVKSVVLRVNEARDLGDKDRLAFYDHMKVYTAAPPDALRCDEKNLREHSVPNICGIAITTNHKTNGLYLPNDDRRHFVAWSDLTRDSFDEDFWSAFWNWYRDGGLRHVAAFLAERDLTKFDAKAPPTKTPAFWSIVDAGRAPEASEMADAIEKLGNPDAVTVTIVAAAAEDDFSAWLRDRRNSRLIPHRFEEAGYVAVRNDADRRDGQWKVGNKRVTVYALASLSRRDQMAAVQALVEREGRR